MGYRSEGEIKHARELPHVTENETKIELGFVY